MDAKLISAGVDWLTLTTKDKARQLEWREVFDFVAQREQANGYKVQSMSVRGYAGKQIGHMFVGFYEGIGLARISSAWASEYGYYFSPDAVNCTRIDLQTTWEMALPEAIKPRDWYLKAKESRPKNGHPTAYTWIENNEGGWTINAGKRVSAQMGRIYDKGREQALAPRCSIIRWELELKEGLANQACMALYGDGEQESKIIGSLAKFFEHKSLPYPRMAGMSAIALTMPKDLPDVEQTLKWLRGPVAKAIARSVAWVGMERTLDACLSETVELSSDQDGLLEAVALLCSSVENYA